MPFLVYIWKHNKPPNTFMLPVAIIYIECTQVLLWAVRVKVTSCLVWVCQCNNTQVASHIK